MGVPPLRRRRRRRLLTALAFLLFASVSASGVVVSVSPSASAPPRRRVKSQSTQSLVVVVIPDGEEAEGVLTQTIRRRLGGPGSSPPTCRSKCGRCTPCQAVHVPIQPGFTFPLEYYPEAWRCKCGNKLFMP